MLHIPSRHVERLQHVRYKSEVAGTLLYLFYLHLYKSTYSTLICKILNHNSEICRIKHYNMPIILIFLFFLFTSCTEKEYSEMKIYKFKDYDLILSYDPADVFRYYDVREMHGLNLKDCLDHPNTFEDSYIAGWCNVQPGTDRPFVYINLTRCTNDMYTTGLIMHEMNHLYWLLHEDHVLDYEETIITKAEEETYKVFELVRNSQTAN